MTEDMSYTERLYVFIMNKCTLKSANILIKTRFQVFGDKMGTASLMDILQACYASHTITYIRNATNFQVLSYDGLNGIIITVATLPGGNLSNTEGQTNATRRPKGIQYTTGNKL
jgi:hypothetical protein